MKKQTRYLQNIKILRMRIKRQYTKQVFMPYFHYGLRRKCENLDNMETLEINTT